MVEIIYWSGTGNTKKMAELIAEGIIAGKHEVGIREIAEASCEDVEVAEILALGCPSMGVEELEDYEMEPFVKGLEGKISRKKVVLFGSYGWGNGEWMDVWKERMIEYGVEMVLEPLIINGAPEGGDVERCIQYGRALVDK